jgi:hypothetical protein
MNNIDITLNNINIDIDIIKFESYSSDEGRQIYP